MKEHDQHHSESLTLQLLSDEDLFCAFIDGNDQAYTAMYHRYSSRLLSYIYSLIGSHNRTAEDIFQECFMRLFRERKRCLAGDAVAVKNVGGWLFRVARNLSLNYLRSAQYLTNIPAYYDEQLVTSVEEAHAEVFGDEYDQQKMLDAVRAVVETLPSGLREVFVLREINGMSYEETASIAGCTTEAARMRLSRARTAIRKALQPLFVNNRD